MVLKSLRERIKNVKAKLERAKAKHHGMTVPELREHLKKRKAERRAFKAELRRKEREERQKYEKWKIEQKYKQRRKRVKAGKPTGFLGALEALGGSQKKSDPLLGPDPLGLFGSPKKKRKRRKKRK